MDNRNSFSTAVKDANGRIRVQLMVKGKPGKQCWRHAVDVREMLKQDPPACVVVQRAKGEPIPAEVPNPEPANADKWEGVTVPELRDIAKRLPSQPTGVGEMTRAQLIELLAKNDVHGPPGGGDEE